MNVLCAANEFGKSTSFEALHALFFQPHSGTPGEVQRLRPYSGGNPLIEADIATSEGRYRLRKQFYGGRQASVTELGSGRLVAQAGEAEAFITDLIRGGKAGPAGLLWVRQGVTGIEERSKKEEEGESRVRKSLLSSVQGEVEAMTGGRRMAEIVEACDTELGRLVTPTKRPKSGGAYCAAVEQHERLCAEELRLGADVAALREALDKRSIALKRLAELEDADEVAARRGALERAEVFHDAAKTHGGALRTAEAELALARDRRDVSERELTGFREAMTGWAKFQDAASAAELQCSQARERLAAAIATADKSSADVQAAENEEAQNRLLLDRLNAMLAARQAADELSEMRDRLEKAEAARTAVERSEAALALLAIPADSVERLQSLEIELAGLRGGREAGLPTLRIAYRDHAAGLVTLNGAPMPGGRDFSVADVAELEIAGVGSLTVRSNRRPAEDKSLKEVEEARRSLLAGLGVGDLAEARRRQAAATEKSAELATLRLQLSQFAPDGVPGLRGEIARRDAQRSADMDLKGDPEEARLALARAGQKVDQARNSAREIQPLRGRADAAIVAAETAYAQAAADLTRLEAVLGPVDPRSARLDRLAAELAGRQSHFTQLEARTKELRRAAPDLTSAEAALRRAKSAFDGCALEVSRLHVTVADLNGQIRARSEDAVEEAWREASEALAAAAERVRRFETEVAVLDRLRVALQASRSAARDLYLRPVITELRPLLGLLFGDISIVFDENTLMPQTVRRNNQDEDVDRLSGGMREQLSILTRLAFARLLARDGKPTPVILDDALVYSDDDRIERMFDALHRQSRDQQIIIFSCRQRAFSKLGGNILRLAEWQPNSA